MMLIILTKMQIAQRQSIKLYKLFGLPFRLIIGVYTQINLTVHPRRHFQVLNWSPSGVKIAANYD